MAGVRKSMPEMQKFSTFRVLFLAILYFKAGKEARCSFFILQRALCRQIDPLINRQEPCFHICRICIPGKILDSPSKAIKDSRA